MSAIEIRFRICAILKVYEISHYTKPFSSVDELQEEARKNLIYAEEHDARMNDKRSY